MNLYAANYQCVSESGDIPRDIAQFLEPGASHGAGVLRDVAKLARRGSPYRQAIGASFDREIPVNDPTNARIMEAISETVNEMWQATGNQQTSELVVTFSGHGGGGSISSVDWQVVSVDDLHALANMVRGFRVHIIYILDTCRAGQLVSSAQAEAANESLDRGADVPQERRGEPRRHFRLLRDLNTHANQIHEATLQLGNAVRWYRRPRNQTPDNFVAIQNWLGALGGHVRTLGTYLQEDENATELVNRRAAMLEHIQAATDHILLTMPADRAGVDTLLRSMAELLGALIEEVNEGLARFDEEIQNARH